MFEGYAELAGVEIVNNARALAYAREMGIDAPCNPCPGLADAAGDGSYTTPAIDSAPWYDPSVPESAGFLGVFGQLLTGVAANPVERAITQLPGDGAALGVLRRTQREMTWTVSLIAVDDCALSYGYAWLAAALRGSMCTESACYGDELCLFACCPEPVPLPGLEVGEWELRHLYDVGLTAGPDEVGRSYTGGSSCAQGQQPVIATVTFTLTAGKPAIHRAPILPALTNPDEWVQLNKGQGPIRYWPPTFWQDRCGMPDPADPVAPAVKRCTDDPLCAPPYVLPKVPDYFNTCGLPKPFGDSNDYTVRVTRIPFSPLAVPDWLEAVPVIRIDSGTRELRAIMIRFNMNPIGLPCTQLDACDICTEINLTYLPPNSRLIIDGRTQRATVDCIAGQSTIRATPALSGILGAPFEWPVFPCSTGMCVEVTAYDRTMTAGSRASVTLVPRGDAG